MKQKYKSLPEKLSVVSKFFKIVNEVAYHHRVNPSIPMD